MSARMVNKKVPINYFIQEEPIFDEYVYCDKCSVFVYEYCSIHGPLLVIPDEKVRHCETPSIMPRAALTIPGVFLHFAISNIPGAGLGVFSSLTLPRGVRFGPYSGYKTRDAESNYCWQIFDKNHKPTHVIDANDSNSSNWMRYINCSRHCREQNLLAYQYKGELYYRTIKIIPKHTELLVFYGARSAHELEIDIAKYNADINYNEIVDKQPKYETKEISSNIDITYETNEEFEINNIIQDSFNDNFQHIKDGPSNYGLPENIQHEEIDSTTNLNMNHLLDGMNNFEKYPNTKENAIANISGDINKDDNNFKKEHYLYECDICLEYKTTNKKYLIIHRLKHGVDKLHKCTFCEYQTNNKVQHDRHLCLHTENFKFRCEKCVYATNEKRYLTRHLLTVHAEKKQMHSCPTCPFTCQKDLLMQTHMKRHENKSLKCDVCHHLFKKHWDLKMHINRKHFK